MKARFLLALLPGLLLLSSFTGQAQTFDEWFRQKKTQRAYLVQQITALEAYASVLREGYHIAQQGLNTVEDIKNGDLGLHQVYFNSLRQVNPAVGGSARLAELFRYQQAISQDFWEVLPALRQSGQLQASELALLEQVKAKVLASCARDLEELQLTLAPHALELTDAQRQQRLEALHHNTRATFRFTRAFLQEAQVLVRQRAQERQELENARSLHGSLQ